MYYQIEKVLEQQQVGIQKTYKGRGILICESADGLFALKEFHGQEKRADYLFRLGTCLEEHGITCDRMLKNREEHLITEGVDGVRYTFHRWIPGRSCDVRNRQETVSAGVFLARFHEAAAHFPGREYLMDPLQDEYARHDRQLKKIRKFILVKNGKTDFERLYLQCSESYIRQSEGVLERITDRADVLADHAEGVCHGDYNQHNVVMDGGQIALLNLEHARCGPQMSDLSNYLRKIMEKNDWNETLGLEILREYAAVHKMEEADWQELYLRLFYPEKFWKIANHYINTRKVMDSGILFEKLRRELRQNESRQRFLDTLKRVRRLA